MAKHTLRESLKLAEKARKIFKDKGYYYEIGTLQGRVSVEIIWGDWKHDHSFVDYVMRNDLGLKKVDETITEEDGSDTYSSIHYFE